MHLTFKRLRATNALTYRELEVPLDNQGLVLINGETKNTPGSNGAGKSNIWEIFSHVLYGATGKEVTNKNIVNRFVGKNYLGEVLLDINGTEYLIKEFRDHSKLGTGIQILQGENQEDITPKRSAGHKEPRNKIVELMDLNLKEFFGLVYLCQNYNHVMVSGTHGEKQAYLSSLFGFDKYDLLYKEAKARKDELDKKLISLSSYQRDLDRAEETLKALPSLDKLQHTIKQSEKDLKTFQKVQQDLTSQLVALEALNSKSLRKKRALEGLRELGLDGQKLTEEGLQTKLSTVKKELRSAEEKARALERTLVQLKQRKNLCQKLPQEPLQDQKVLKSNLKMVKEVTLEHQRLKERVVQREAIEAQLKQFPPKVPALSELAPKVNMLSTQLGKATAAHDIARKTAKQVSSIKGTCPTCNRPLAEKERNSILKDLKVPELKDKMSLLEKDLKEHLRLEKIAKTKEPLKARLDQLPKGKSTVIETILASCRDQEKQITQDLHTWTTIRTLKEQLKELPKGDIQETTRELKELRGIITKRKKESDSLIRALGWIKDAHLDIKGSCAPDDIKAKKRELDEVYTKLQETATKKAEALQSKDLLMEIQGQKETAEKQLAIYKKLQPKQESLQYLMKAFGNKGLKTTRLRLVTQQLVNLLPGYLNPMFAGSPYRVRVHKDVEMELYFEHNGKTIVIPAKGASGGEKKALSLSSLFALRGLKSSQKSSNILIADEPYNDLDERKKEVLTELFLELKEERIVSSIFVITHENKVLQQGFDQIWTVTKQDYFSVLRK